MDLSTLTGQKAEALRVTAVGLYAVILVVKKDYLMVIPNTLYTTVLICPQPS